MAIAEIRQLRQLEGDNQKLKYLVVDLTAVVIYSSENRLYFLARPSG